MSQGDLYRILKKVEKDLRKGTYGDAFRKFEADIAPHIFTVNTAKVQAEVKRQMLAYYGGSRGSNTKLPKALETVIDTEVPKFTARLYDAFASPGFLRAYSFSIIKGNPKNFVVKVELGPYASSSSSVFVAIRDRKRKAQKPLIMALNKALASIGREQEIEPNAFLDLGHEKGLAFERAEQALDTIGEKLQGIKLNQQTKEFRAVIKSLRAIGIRLNLSTRWPKDVKEFTVGISLEAATFNRLKGSKEEKEIITNLKNTITETLKEYPSWANDSTSDSYMTFVEKTIIQTFSKAIKSGRYVKETWDPKLLKAVDKKPAKALGPIRRPKIKPVPITEPVLDLNEVKKPEQNRQQSGQDILRLQFLINERLPPTVRKNMVEPALVNRTGRFAESTRITDIILTPKGFPSIGYTYQKNPYQVFETTAGKEPWATPDRDPRKIIDRSIREIAAEYLAGRFFTRRV